jgi:putative oxidoreductase
MGMRNLILRVKNLHDKFFSLASYAQTPFLLFVRLEWGWQLIESGWGKLHNLDKVTEFFTSLNLPMPGPTAVFVSSLEFFGGILLAIGLFSRVISLMLSVNLIMAYITADREALLTIFSDNDKFFGATPFTFLFASLLVLIFGPGKIALDTLLGRWFRGPEAQAVGSAPN